MITDIIWDFDGTLFDTYPSMVNAFKIALKDYNIEDSDENILGYMKVSFSEAVKYYSSIYNLNDEMIKALIEKFRYYEKNNSAKLVEPFPYAKEICEWIKNSGGRNFILTHRGNSTIDYLKAHNMEDYFTEVVTKHHGFKRKPDPEGYIHLLDKYSINKESAMIVGDRDFEILAGKKAGIKVCLYNTNNIVPAEQPEYSISSLSELKNII